MKNVAIIYRENTQRTFELTKDLSNWLSERKIHVHFAPEQSHSELSGSAIDPTDRHKLELVIVLGGDGTYLEAVRFIGEHQVPVVGINMGSLGFLTENRADDLYKVVEDAIGGKLVPQPLTLLAIDVHGQSGLRHFVALNDIVFERGASPNLLNIGIYSGDSLVTESKADGMIVSSPTGSTAYNLAAGGPVLHPQVHALVVTPICPHSLTSRPLLFPDDRQLQLRLLGQNKSAQLSIDGKNIGDITEKDKVIICRHKIQHHVLRKASYNYFALLREKLKFGERD